MRVITGIKDMRSVSKEARMSGKTVGLVPTMGFLHEGHLSLIRAAAGECGFVAVSVFVNPTQFGEGEDLESYPRDLERDTGLAEEAGADVVFAPGVEEMYPDGAGTVVHAPPGLTGVLCGRSRPGHFTGVATVVLKLFNIVAPDRAYFGRKDAQQCAVVKRMVRDLDVPVEIKVMPVVREKDGLAMSSRNTYLSPEGRSTARAVHKALRKAEEMVCSGILSADEVKAGMYKILNKAEGLEVEYIEIVDPETMEARSDAGANALIAVAARVGGTRLIDNILVSSEQWMVSDRRRGVGNDE
ncbi:MAG: pantoate--beta-alanine ligase [Candidatus Omnitrophica bacterium]|nr:pantoate--beta-alanine ligase [Candidatus Omnitrophota bacterium]